VQVGPLAYRSRMDQEPKDVRLPIMVTATEAKAIDDWRFDKRIHTRAEAIRQLIALGLKARN
jgi:hypothetical protein